MRLLRYVLVPLGIVASLGSGWLVYCSSLEQAEPTHTRKSADSLAVQVTRIQRRTLEERADLVGSLEAGSQVELRSRISGYVTKLRFDVGDYVEAGKLVIELDNSTQLEQVSRAQAACKVAQAQLRAKQTKVEQAEKEVARQRKLAGSRVITKEQLETFEAQLAIAQAEFELEQAHLDEAESDLHRSQLALLDTRILAPMSGWVAERSVDIGDLAGPNSPLMRIVHLEKVRTMVHVVEKDYQRVQVNQPATITVDAFPHQSFTGKVVRKAPVLDLQTRTAAVQIEIPNPQVLLKPGMYGRVSLVFGQRKNVAVVPLSSLIENGSRPALYVVSGDPPQTRLMEVRTGIIDGDLVEILGGLGQGDRVVTLGNRLVQHGQSVVPVETDWPETLANDDTHLLADGDAVAASNGATGD